MVVLYIYGKDLEVKGRLWDGKCYVFDERIAVPINQTDEDVIISNCMHCGKQSDRYINCSNDDCHLQHISWEVCDEIHHHFCSDACRDHAEIHPERNHTLKNY